MSVVGGSLKKKIRGAVIRRRSNRSQNPAHHSISRSARTRIDCGILISSVFAVFMLIINFFFFQAEDGIRDLTVTGVQTCALPISISDGYGADARLVASCVPVS